MGSEKRAMLFVLGAATGVAFLLYAYRSGVYTGGSSTPAAKGGMHPPHLELHDSKNRIPRVQKRHLWTSTSIMCGVIIHEVMGIVRLLLVSLATAAAFLYPPRLDTNALLLCLFVVVNVSAYISFAQRRRIVTLFRCCLPSWPAAMALAVNPLVMTAAAPKCAHRPLVRYTGTVRRTRARVCVCECARLCVWLCVH